MERFGDWVVSRLLGEGGQGQVFLVRNLKSRTLQDIQHKFNISISEFTALPTPVDPRGQRFVEVLLGAFATFSDSELGALKVLHAPEHAKNPKTAEIRFRKEIKVLRELSHPGLVKLLDSNVDERWFVMELHAGQLQQVRHLYERNLRGTLSAIRPVIEAVSKLHERELIHRDIKPDNIFVSDHGSLVLGDLGLVHELNSTEERPTLTYENVGSRDWMPTWAVGMRVDEIPFAFDVFTLGKVIWSMLSGKSFLRYHYFKDAEFNLERLFPGDPDMQTANEFLEKCITERAEEGLQGAAEMLSEVDKMMRGTSDVSTVSSPTPEEIAAENQDAAQSAELEEFLIEYNSFLRRLAVEWRTARESSPNSLFAANDILSAVDGPLLGFCSKEALDAFPGLQDEMESVLVDLRKLRHSAAVEDDHRTKEIFWDTGTAAIDRLQGIAANARAFIVA